MTVAGICVIRQHAGTDTDLFPAGRQSESNVRLRLRAGGAFQL